MRVWPGSPVSSCAFCVALASVAVAGPARADAEVGVPALAEPSAPVGSWATNQAADLTARGRADAARGDVQSATKRYLEAIRFDGSYGPAYLALGNLYETTGEPKEADRTYAMGIEHVTGFVEARVARAHLAVGTKRWADAAVELEAAAEARPDDLALLRELLRAYNAIEARPAALATARRMAAVATRLGDAAARDEARVFARALVALVDDADPVVMGRRSPLAVRRALAGYALRPR